MQLKTELYRLMDLLEVSNKKGTGIFVHCKDGISENDRELIRDFHGTDILPDDFRFMIILSILECLMNYNFENVEQIKDNSIDCEITDELIDTYNHDLLKWLSSNLIRVEYCNQAVAEGLCNGDNLLDTIRTGQYLEIKEIMNRILNHLETVEVQDENNL